jgi:hypothetical protein
MFQFFELNQLKIVGYKQPTVKEEEAGWLSLMSITVETVSPM